MIESDVLVGTRLGRMPAFAVHPEGPGFPERAAHRPEAAENAFNKLTAMWRRTLG
jgi:hypothetical protein